MSFTSPVGANMYCGLYFYSGSRSVYWHWQCISFFL